MSTKKILNFLLLCFGIMGIIYVGASIVNADFTMRSWTDEARGLVGALMFMGLMGAAALVFLWDE